VLQPLQKDPDTEPELDADLDQELQARTQTRSTGTDDNEDPEQSLEAPLLRPFSQTSDGHHEDRVARQFDIRGLCPRIESDQVTQQCALGVPRIGRSMSEDAATPGSEAFHDLATSFHGHIGEGLESVQGTLASGLESFKSYLGRPSSFGN